jgi:hypothetical protein
MGQLGPVVAGDTEDFYFDIAKDLATGETITSVDFTVTDAKGATVAGVVGAHTETSTRTDFRITAPAAGGYTITAEFTSSSGEVLTRTADLWVV